MIGGVRPWPCRLVRLTVAMASVLAALSMLVAACSATAVPQASAAVPACSSGSACASASAATPSTTSTSAEEGENDAVISWVVRTLVALAILGVILALARRIGSRSAAVPLNSDVDVEPELSPRAQQHGPER